MTKKGMRQLAKTKKDFTDVVHSHLCLHARNGNRYEHVTFVPSKCPHENIFHCFLSSYLQELASVSYFITLQLQNSMHFTGLL